VVVLRQQVEDDNPYVPVCCYM